MEKKIGLNVAVHVNRGFSCNINRLIEDCITIHFGSEVVVFFQEKQLGQLCDAIKDFEKLTKKKQKYGIERFIKGKNEEVSR